MSRYEHFKAAAKVAALAVSRIPGLRGATDRFAALVADAAIDVVKKLHPRTSTVMVEGLPKTQQTFHGHIVRESLVQDFSIDHVSVEIRRLENGLHQVITWLNDQSTVVAVV